jgi:hypothetical protein
LDFNYWNSFIWNCVKEISFWVTVSFCLLYKNIRMECITLYFFASEPAWLWNLVSDIKEETQTESVWEQGAEENIWTEERWSDRRVENTVLNFWVT